MDSWNESGLSDNQLVSCLESVENSLVEIEDESDISDSQLVSCLDSTEISLVGFEENEVSDAELAECLEFVENSMSVFPEDGDQWGVNIADSDFLNLENGMDSSQNSQVSI
jgi:hypothetical protein